MRIWFIKCSDTTPSYLRGKKEGSEQRKCAMVLAPKVNPQSFSTLCQYCSSSLLLCRLSLHTRHNKNSMPSVLTDQFSAQRCFYKGFSLSSFSSYRLLRSLTVGELPVEEFLQFTSSSLLSLSTSGTFDISCVKHLLSSSSFPSLSSLSIGSVDAESMALLLSHTHPSLSTLSALVKCTPQLVPLFSTCHFFSLRLLPVAVGSRLQSYLEEYESAVKQQAEKNPHLCRFYFDQTRPCLYQKNILSRLRWRSVATPLSFVRANTSCKATASFFGDSILPLMQHVFTHLWSNEHDQNEQNVRNWDAEELEKRRLKAWDEFRKQHPDYGARFRQSRGRVRRLGRSWR